MEAKKIELCAQSISNYAKVWQYESMAQSRDMIESNILELFDELESLIVED